MAHRRTPLFFPSKPSKKTTHKRKRRRRSFEKLETRRLLVTQFIFVETTADELTLDNGVPVLSRPYSLREALVKAHQSDSEDVRVILQPDTEYKITRNDPSAEGTSRDLYWNDFDITRDLVIAGVGSVVDGDNQNRLFDIKGRASGIEVEIANFSLVKGSGGGGGVRIDNAGGTVTVSNAVISGALYEHDNFARGAAIEVKGGRLVIESSTLENNVARGGTGASDTSSNDVNNGGDGVDAKGAAIYAVDAEVIVRDSLIQNNEADAGAGGEGDDTGGNGGVAEGGAIYVSGGFVRSIRSEFLNNTAVSGRGGDSQNGPAGDSGTASGGGIYADNDVTEIRITDSRFEGNTARTRNGGRGRFDDSNGGHSRDARGGAILAAALELNVTDSIFVGNLAMAEPGGPSAHAGKAGNGGNSFGGAIDIRPGNVSTTITGELIPTGSTPLDEADVGEVTYSTMFIDNQVLGGDGGVKAKPREQGGTAGTSGRAQGGAIRNVGTGTMTIDGVNLVGNLASGGRGADGASFVEDCGDDLCLGTVGGDSGDAMGGGLYSTVTTTMTNSSVINNSVTGGKENEFGIISGGAGGFDEDGNGLRGGNGGDAIGGGAFFARADVTIQNSGFAGNSAFGGWGGTGGLGVGVDDDEDGRGADGGNGGEARGGGVAIFPDPENSVILEQLFVSSNMVMAGAGGTGGDAAQGGEVGDVNKTGTLADGGKGGQGGNASGGGISVRNLNDSARASLSLSDSIVSGNVVIAGDGGVGGRGGIGVPIRRDFDIDDDPVFTYVSYGGVGGDGGDGGQADGGGVALRGVTGIVDGNTVDHNTASGGFGGRGGHGGSGAIHRTDVNFNTNLFLATDGGDGGDGGEGGLAAGGGISSRINDINVHRNTIAKNIALSGGGGFGGFGAPGTADGGNGGDGGRSGDAAGGGIANLDFEKTNGAEPVLVTGTTIVENTVNAGPAGLGGRAGQVVSSPFNAQLERVNFQTNPVTGEGDRFVFSSSVVLAGVAAEVDPIFANPDPLSTEIRTSSSLVGSIGQADVASIGVTAGAGAAVFTGVTAATAGGLFASSLIASYGFGGAAVAGAGAFLGPGAVLGAAVALPVAVAVGIGFQIGVSMYSGDSFGEAINGVFENDFDFQGVNFGALFFTNNSEPQYVPPSGVGPGNAGVDASPGRAIGSGINGDSTIAATIVAANETRSRSLEFVSDLNSVFFDGEIVQALKTHEEPDLGAGEIDSSLFNLIGREELADGTIVTVDPKIDPGFGLYGGFAPTIRLQPSSPARNAVPSTAVGTIVLDQFSQNGFEFADTLHIGAWGGDLLDTTVTGPAGPIDNAPFTVTVDFGGPVNDFELDDISIVGGEVQSEISLGADDRYSFEVAANVTADELSIRINENQVADNFGSNNKTSNTFSVAVDIVDTTAPSSSVDLLPATADALTFDINLTATDADTSDIPGTSTTGVSQIDVYVATDDGPFVLHETLNGDDRTSSFTGESDHLYWFRSVARDAVGNEEVKPIVADTFIYVPDLDAPQTNVVSVTPTDIGWTLEVTGSDSGGSGLSEITLDVSIDSEAPVTLGTFDAGAADGSGNHTITIPYQAMLDGVSHTYEFSSRGTDGRGNVEPAPATADVSVTETFEQPSQLELTTFDIQHGARQRSYIRDIDLNFNLTRDFQGIINSVNDADADNDRLVLERNVDGVFEKIDLAGLVSTSSGDPTNVLTIDFGSEGLGGDSRSADGNGSYRISVDGNNDGTLGQSFDFHRLLGDANGDGIVDRIDMMDVLAGMRTPHDNADIDGDGNINLVDRAIVQRELVGSSSASGEPLTRSAADTAAITTPQAVTVMESVFSPLRTSVWQNQSEAGDVNNDGRVSALDALIVINQLNSRSHSNDRGTIAWEASSESDTPMLMDANGDEKVTAVDALHVINHLNASGNTATPEPIELPVDSTASSLAPPDRQAERIETTDHLFAQEGLLF